MDAYKYVDVLNLVCMHAFTNKRIDAQQKTLKHEYRSGRRTGGGQEDRRTQVRNCTQQGMCMKGFTEAQPNFEPKDFDHDNDIPRSSLLFSSSLLSWSIMVNHEHASTTYHRTLISAVSNDLAMTGLSFLRLYNTHRNIYNIRIQN
jgi:hypothetical protein